MNRPDTARGLLPLLTTQFLGAFNDNAFKMLVVLLGFAAANGADETQKQAVATTAFVVMTLPLMLGSIPAMLLGDRISKRTLVVRTKLAELILMAAGTVALVVSPNGWAPLAVLAGMGLQSALFAPGKYGLLPELLPHEQLARANGRLEAASFVAIILGTVAGGLLLEHSGAIWIAGAILTALSACGLAAAMRIPAVPASGQREGASVAIRSAVRAVRSDRTLYLATLGMTLFWGIASLLGQDVLVYARHELGLSDSIAAVPYALFAIGVGAGSLLAGRLSAGKVESGLIPLGALGLALATALFGSLQPGLGGTLAAMALLGLASGFVLVPLNALIQWRAPSARRGAVIALVNMLSFAGMLVGNLGCLALASAGFGSPAILLAAALVTLAGSVWAVLLLPEALMRTVVILATSTLYRVRTIGRHHVPEQGGVLLLPNHVSFVDALLLVTATDRPIRFVIDRSWYERRWLRPFLDATGAIPISTSDGPRNMLRALRAAGEALDQGDVVCMFPEGEISRMGSTLPFRRGMNRILRGRNAVVVPAHLDRVYGALGSAEQGRVRWLPSRLRYPVTMSFGAPLANDVRPERARLAVEELAERAAALRTTELEPLHVPFIRHARRAPLRRCLADSQGRKLSRIGALAGSLILAKRLQPTWREQRHVGILLPPSIPGALAALAASMGGRVAVPLNYTAGRTALASAIRQAGLRSVLTSRAFLERLPSDIADSLSGVQLHFVEDCLAGVRWTERLAGLARALLLPRRQLERSAGARQRVQIDDVATILFSSGSTGEPKGVVLTHQNLQSNCEAVAQVVPLDRHDALASVLPLFHSFGCMALWYVLNQGGRIAFHPNPLDADAVGRLVASQNATLLIATPTFLQMYMRRVEPGRFGSLRLVLTGAEKLTDELAAAFADRFGLRPVQGYGATECAPVIATSAPGYRAPGFFQAGTRRGSVGRPLPGVTVQVVDPDTREPLPVGEPGLLIVRGPNVMRGYLGREDLTEEALRDGAYVTGDVGYLDQDGFLFLTDRLSRFSKIGGEMVPHGTVEEHLQACSGRTERAFAVCGVPDDRKGERLAVLTTLGPRELHEALAGLQGRGLPALFVPRVSQFLHVDALPILGTGKLDLRRVREIALAQHADPV
jgi:acyl-[acyl-carrier-protein]-phospholipid O-acyltransferase/long-chain-fatty-acid--[acyl-carrier-protein] ligase